VRRLVPVSIAVLLVVAFALATAACGGGGNGKKTTTTSSTSAQPDPGRDTIDALLAAATKKDAGAIWSLLSTPSRKRLGPTLAAFKSESADTIEKALEPFAGLPVKPFVSQRISQQFGIVAINRGVAALALPLRNEGGAWKIEAPGPVKIDISGPRPGSSGVVGQVGIEIHAPGPPSVGLIWVDGQSVEPKIYTGRKSATVFANLAENLSPGTHLAVAYAEEGRDATAVAWTFEATKS
jgi:hypothetical protein